MGSVTDSPEITKRVLKLMEDRNITGYRLCKDLNISNGSFVNLKKGRQNWGLESLIKIALYFKVSLDYLIFGEDDNKLVDDYVDYKMKLYEDELMVLRDKESKYGKLINELKNVQGENPQ